MTTTIASGFVSFSPALLHAKSRRPYPNFRIRPSFLPVVSASLSHIDADTTTTLYSNVLKERIRSPNCCITSLWQILIQEQRS